MDRLLELVSDDNVDINWTSNGSSLPPLMCLCEKNKTEDFDRCFEAVMRRDDINVHVTNSNYMNALHLLCQLNERLSLSAVEKLIQRGIDVKAQTGDGWNALHFLCGSSICRDMAQVARLLIRSGLNPNVLTTNRDNALIILCRNSENPNLMETARLLITEHNLNVNHTNGFVNNAMHFLVSRNRYENGNVIELAQFLVANGIYVNAKTSQEHDALQLLLMEEHNSEVSDYAIQLIRILIEAGINPNHNESLTLLCKYATDPLLLAVLRLLVTEFGVDVNQINSKRENALHCLFQNANQSRCLLEIVEFLIGANISVNAVTTDGSNTLHLLCKSVRNDNLLDVIRLLVNAGADARAVNGAEKSAISIIWDRKEKIPNATEIVQYLIDSAPAVE